MRRLADAREQVDTWRGLESRATELQQLLQLARDESDEELSQDIGSDVQSLAREFEEMELALALAGEYDRRDAILAIHAGAGGTDSQDWAEMLLRMYLRWADKRGYKTDVLDMTTGEEAGIKSATVEVRGRNAYGYLRGERGVHRLVRISPYDASKSRHTSFALAEVLPEVESEAEVRLDPDDLRIDTFRASGHGGQNVQKNATAIRITHIPTGMVVTCQNERSQSRNKESALKVLEARLLEKELERRAEEQSRLKGEHDALQQSQIAKGCLGNVAATHPAAQPAAAGGTAATEEEQSRLKGEHVSAEWGNQIRSYVLHPYKMVKDHRTGFETSDAELVLDGDLDPLLRAYQKSTLGD